MDVQTRNAQITELLLDGLSNKEIARKLFISEQTVKYHLKNMFLENSVKSRTELALHLQKKKYKFFVLD